MQLKGQSQGCNDVGAVHDAELPQERDGVGAGKPLKSALRLTAFAGLGCLCNLAALRLAAFVLLICLGK
eukprot:scaffold354202_cov14-Prasinocladus_malaysianus.AAC.1